jgi:hypothetical protein
MMGNQKIPVTIAQLDPLELELLSGDESIEITISTRPDGGGTGKKTFRTTLNNVISIYSRWKNNPNDVTAEQVGSYSIEQMTAILKEKLGVDGVAINSIRLDGSTKQEIIEETRSGKVNDSYNLGGLPAGDYTLNSEFANALEKVAQSFDDMTMNISS